MSRPSTMTDHDTTGGFDVARRRFIQSVGAGATATALAGCLGDSVPEDAIRIGALAPNPGTDPVGASIVNGAQVAVDELNEDGGILGNEVALFDENTAEGPQDAYQNLVLEEGVDVTTGFFASESLLACIDLIADEQTLHLTTGSGTPEVPALLEEDYDTYRYHFRVGPYNSVHLGQSLVDFAEAFFEEIGWDRVGVMIEEAAWTGPTAEVIREQMPDLGFELTEIKEYALETSNFSPIYDDFEDQDVDGVTTAIAHTGQTAASQWHNQQRPFGFGGIHVPAQFPIMWSALDGAIEYVWTQTSAAPGTAITPKTEQFTERYIDDHRNQPVYTGYITYDAVMVYAAYAEAAGTTDPEELIPMMANNEVSYQGTTFEEQVFYGPDGEFPHDVVYDREDWIEGRSAPIWIQWQDEEQVTFKPDAHAATDYQQPDWI